MINKFIEYLKNVDKLTYKIMKKGLKFCFGLLVLSSFALIIYGLFAFSLDLYYIGLSLFKLGCTLGVEFIVCGLVMDTVKKQLI